MIDDWTCEAFVSLVSQFKKNQTFLATAKDQPSAQEKKKSWLWSVNENWGKFLYDDELKNSIKVSRSTLSNELLYFSWNFHFKYSETSTKRAKTRSVMGVIFQQQLMEKYPRKRRRRKPIWLSRSKLRNERFCFSGNFDFKKDQKINSARKEQTFSGHEVSKTIDEEKL